MSDPLDSGGAANMSAPPPTSDIPKDARMWATIAHLSALAGFLIPVAGNIVAPLIVWLIKREEHPFIDDQGKEALNFQITVTIALIVCFALMCVAIGVFLMPIVGLAALVFIIIAAIQANNGVAYRYPLTIRLVK